MSGDRRLKPDGERGRFGSDDVSISGQFAAVFITVKNSFCNNSERRSGCRGVGGRRPSAGTGLLIVPLVTFNAGCSNREGCPGAFVGCQILRLGNDDRNGRGIFPFRVKRDFSLRDEMCDIADALRAFLVIIPPCDRNAAAVDKPAEIAAVTLDNAPDKVVIAKVEFITVGIEVNVVAPGPLGVDCRVLLDRNEGGQIVDHLRAGTVKTVAGKDGDIFGLIEVPASVPHGLAGKKQYAVEFKHIDLGVVIGRIAVKGDQHRIYPFGVKRKRPGRKNAACQRLCAGAVKVPPSDDLALVSVRTQITHLSIGEMLRNRLVGGNENDKRLAELGVVPIIEEFCSVAVKGDFYSGSPNRIVCRIFIDLIVKTDVDFAASGRRITGENESVLDEFIRSAVDIHRSEIIRTQAALKFI